MGRKVVQKSKRTTSAPEYAWRHSVAGILATIQKLPTRGHPAGMRWVAGSLRYYHRCLRELIDSAPPSCRAFADRLRQDLDREERED